MGKDVVSCRNCDRTYKKNKNGSTSAYLRHLKDSHQDLYTEFSKAMDLRAEKDKIQRELDDKQSLKRHFPAVEKPVMQQAGPSKIARNDGLQTIEEAISMWPTDSAKSVALDSAIIQMIASDILPLSVVDNPGFRQVMQIAAPKYHLHGRNYFAREMLPQHYDKMKNHVSSIISEANSISITTDCWSDANNTHSVISATAHFLDHEMQPKFLVLAAEPIVGAHNSQN
ncbi:zinc finger BED domain-containing protein 1 [Ditylenchus destructor]|uniref:Zinc finger BED domain-containing protein 1 n=1 Tax=Ditylenchus destructor TaxID=166010 RepID=A0AAD4MF59_9BILA|nr:zinc finger BED domain-containing protein 1 [Ditylenchus destructor]